MAQMNTSHRYIYDAAPATLFRGREEPAMVSFGNSEPVMLDTLAGYWNVDGELADETLAVIVNVVNGNGGTHSVSINPIDADGNDIFDVAFGSQSIDAPGQYVFLIDVATAKLSDPLLAGLKLAWGVNGGNLEAHAWISQIKSA